MVLLSGSQGLEQVMCQPQGPWSKSIDPLCEKGRSSIMDRKGSGEGLKPVLNRCQGDGGGVADQELVDRGHLTAVVG